MDWGWSEERGVPFWLLKPDEHRAVHEEARRMLRIVGSEPTEQDAFKFDLDDAPVLAIGDGALGLSGALGDVFPAGREQRCWVHYADLRIMPTSRRVQFKFAQAGRYNHGVLRSAGPSRIQEAFSERLALTSFTSHHRIGSAVSGRGRYVSAACQ